MLFAEVQIAKIKHLCLLIVRAASSCPKITVKQLGFFEPDKYFLENSSWYSTFAEKEIYALVLINDWLCFDFSMCPRRKVRGF